MIRRKARQAGSFPLVAEIRKKSGGLFSNSGNDKPSGGIFGSTNGDKSGGLFGKKTPEVSTSQSSTQSGGLFSNSTSKKDDKPARRRFCLEGKAGAGCLIWVERRIIRQR
eukprot:UN17931